MDFLILGVGCVACAIGTYAMLYWLQKFLDWISKPRGPQ